MEKFNLEMLGVRYTILDQDTNETDIIRVVEFEELISTLGRFVGNAKTDITPHMEELLKQFHGFVSSPYKITWYVQIQEDFDLSKAIMAARKEGNNVIITQILPDKELDTGFKIS